MSETAARRMAVAFGPAFPGVGSWEWLGADVSDELAGTYDTCHYTDEPPPADVVVVIKYPPFLAKLPARTALVYCPVDYYGRAAEIDASAEFLRRCDAVVVHCETLRKYFQSYAPVESLDHHLKFIADPPPERRPSGPILWVGLRTNLPPLVEWVRRHRLPADLLVLTNLADDEPPASGAAFGFPESVSVTVEQWTPERHRTALGTCRAAIDLKAGHFRARHKPPAKAFDFLASGLPLAMNADSGIARLLRTRGFELAVPEDAERWLSDAYWEQTQAFGRPLRERLSRTAIGQRWREILEQSAAHRSRRWSASEDSGSPSKRQGDRP